MKYKNLILLLKFLKDSNDTRSSFKILINIKDLPSHIEERCYKKVLTSPEFSLYLLTSNSFSVRKDMKEKLKNKCCEDPEWSYELLVHRSHLTEDVKRRAEEKCLESPKWSFHLREFFNFMNVNVDMKRKLELKACEDPTYRNLLKKYVKNIVISEEYYMKGEGEKK